ncbi:hypothetical protein Bca101_017929 [Brassica carinata]
MTGLWKDLPEKIHHKVSENWISASLLVTLVLGTYCFFSERKCDFNIPQSIDRSIDHSCNPNEELGGRRTTTKMKPSGHSRTRSGPLMKPKTDKNVPLQIPSKPPTMEKKNHCSSRSHTLLQFTLRKGISLYQFVVDNNVLAATVKS